jgi:stage II sporulation protein AA (anti-sigma F factor antagonist)
LEIYGRERIIFSNKTKEEEMESNYYNDEKLLVLRLTEEIDEYTAQKIRRKADYEIERYMPRKVIFDFNSVTFMDSAGIGLIIGRYRIANMLGGTVEIANVTDSIKRVLELSGLLKIIKITELEEMAG